MKFIVCMGYTIMKSALKRKNYYLDERKIRRARAILGARTETEPVDAALDLVLFRSKLLSTRPDLKTKLPALLNDCLLALSARSLGATLYTRNRDDFILLRTIRSFSLVVIR